MAGLNLDIKEFSQALKLYQRATGKDAAEIINRAGRNAAFRSIQFTPKARVAAVKKFDPTKKNYAGRLLYAVATGNGWRRGKGIGAEAKRLYLKRQMSRGYISAGWIKAAQDFGGRPRSRTSKLYPGGRAARGSGRKATPVRPVAVMKNFSTGAEVVGPKPLDRAIRFVARDMTKFANRKLAKTARKFSGR